MEGRKAIKTNKILLHYGKLIKKNSDLPTMMF